MSRHWWFKALLLALTVLVVGCSDKDGVMESEQVTAPIDSMSVVAPLGYPNYSFCLNVPWICQYPPGDRYNTKNCGQACGVMLGGYFNHGAVQPWVITSENQMLYNLTGEARYLEPNGWYTGGSKLWAFREMLRRFHGLQTNVYYGNHADDVINEVAQGRPVIVGVMISGGQIVCSGGQAHWALAIGWDGRVILHDPGSVYGAFRALSLQAFECTWATQGKIYIPVRR